MKDDPKKGLASEFFRMRTAIIRNWGHTRQVFDWLLEMFEPHNQDLLATRGITFDQAIGAVKAILDVIKKRIDDLHRAFRPVATATTKNQLLSAYIHLANPSEEEMDAIKAQNFSFEDLRNYAIVQLDRFLYELFLFTDKDLASISSKDVSTRLKSVFLHWAAPLGTLKATPRDHLMMANPISLAPIIEVESRMLFWPLIFVFQSFGLEMLAGLLDN